MVRLFCGGLSYAYLAGLFNTLKEKTTATIKAMTEKPKFDYANIPAGHKTSRIGGSITKYILELIRLKGQITWKDLLPVMTYRRAVTNLYALKKIGKLKLQSKGKRGRCAPIPAVFKIAEELK